MSTADARGTEQMLLNWKKTPHKDIDTMKPISHLVVGLLLYKK